MSDSSRMSKNQPPASVGSGGLRGDVSFIRATPGTGVSTAPNMPPTNQNQSPSHLPRMPHDMPLQPHLYHQQHHHHQRQQPHPQQQQHSHSQQYLPDHMEAQQYMLKQPHGAGGASGESVNRMPSHTGVEGWSEREEALAAELEEAKIRVAQMEKTMRWWSDCTSNWREKWNKARNERNKAREENRLLRTKLESLAKELSRLKRERKETSAEKELSAEENQLVNSSTSSKSQEKLVELSEKEKTVLAGSNEKDSESMDDLSETSSVTKPHGDQQEEKDVDDCESSTLREGSTTGENTAAVAEMSERLTHLRQKQGQLEEELQQVQTKFAQASENVVMMQRKLDEANNTIQAERLENCNHMKTMDKLQTELRDAQTKLEGANQGKQELKLQKSTDSELSLEGLEKTKVQHQEDLRRLSLDLEDETCSRATMDRRVMDLRRELERIQAENASEWAKRERLESDKLALERDNKKLRTQVTDLEEELEKRSQATSSMADSDIKTLQFEMAEKTKELADLRHVHGKLKKVLTERSTELDHTRRRAEQYETEVRKLRSRVDELKHDLASAEDEVDNQGNAARKAQRANDELQAQVDSLQVQVNHLQSRLRSKHGDVTTPRSTSLKSLTLEDSAELADSETEFDDL